MRIGVTGTYASGKGTVCEMFAELGAEIIDTDMIAREIVAPGSLGLKNIESAFGQKYLNQDGTLNRRLLGQTVFKNQQLTDLLNSITHPLILEKTLERSKNADIIYMINAPVLFESGFNAYMDKIIVLNTPDDSLIARGQNRDGLSENEIRDRISRQFSLNIKLQNADYVIDNSGSLENTRKQVVAIWKILKTSNSAP